MQLPLRSTLQSYTGAFLHEAGAAAESITKQVELYEASIANCKYERKLAPQSDGALIFDEVKVVSGLIWNSQSQRIIGLAIVYKMRINLFLLINMCSNMFQFLWRDLT